MRETWSPRLAVKRNNQLFAVAFKCTRTEIWVSSGRKTVYFNDYIRTFLTTKYWSSNRWITAWFCVPLSLFNCGAVRLDNGWFFFSFKCFEIYINCPKTVRKPPQHPPYPKRRYSTLFNYLYTELGTNNWLYLEKQRVLVTTKWLRYSYFIFMIN